MTSPSGAPTQIRKCDPAWPNRWVDASRYGFGECYFECSKDQAEELLEKKKEDTQAEISKLKGELSTIHDTLSGLKTQLCATPNPWTLTTRASQPGHPPP